MVLVSASAAVRPDDPATGADRSRVSGRASRCAIDGKLDEEVYKSTPAITDFVQQEPDEFKPATEKTEAWIFFDEDNIYISARNWETHPERRVANEMRRDTNQLRQNDTFGVMFDTFHDKRNGYIFYANAIGGLADSQVTDEGRRTPTGTRCGTSAPATSTAAGRSRWRSRSSRCAISPAPIRSGASTCGASSAGRTSGRTWRRCRAR